MLTIIYYHEVVPAGEGYSYQKIEVDKFEAQMKYLHDAGYYTARFSELKEKLPEKSVIVSFDDGFRSVFHYAAPIMKKYGIIGNVYLPTAYIGQEKEFMDWNMIGQLTEYFEFQAHTHNHADIRTLTAEQMREEIRLSDEQFEKNLGYKPVAFCMPFGTYDHCSVKLLKSMDRYTYLLGSYYGTVKNIIPKQMFPRIGISNDDTIEIFEKKLKGNFNWKGPMQRIRLGLYNLKKERITEYKYN